MHYPDLAPCTYYGSPFDPDFFQPPPLAVGRLERGGGYAVGRVDDACLEAMRRLVAGAEATRILARIVQREVGWLRRMDGEFEPVDYFHGTAGRHVCSLCEGGDPPSSCGEILVPGKGVTYYVPRELLVHYIEEHGYRPPEPFLQAVAEAPDPEDDAYLDAVLTSWEFAERLRRSQPRPRWVLPLGFRGLGSQRPK